MYREGVSLWYSNLMVLRSRRTRRRVAPILVVFSFLLVSPSAWPDDTITIDLESTVVLFYSDDCPHCHNEIAWLDSIRDDFPELDFLAFEIGVSNDPYAQRVFAETMEALGSNTTAWPRTVIGNEVYIGFAPGTGEKVWSAPHRAFIGYENQLYGAIARLNAPFARAPAERGRAASGMGPASRITNVTGVNRAIVLSLALVLVAALSVVVVVGRRYAKGAVERRYLWGGFFLLAIAALFVLIARLPDTGVTALAERAPFPLFVAIVAIADGFNPCAFAVLFILLSLLTYTRSRRRMAVLGGTFVATSAVMYGVMILVLVAFGAFLLSRIGTVLFRVLGLGVLVFGIVNSIDWVRNRPAQLALTAEQKSNFGRRAAAIVERLNLADRWTGTLTALLGTIALAVVVNLVEVGCTAILPVVFVSTLLSRYGSTVGVPHILWTLAYGVLYVLPMILILVNFVFTFRSRRLSERAGRALKGANALLMLLLGGYLVVG